MSTGSGDAPAALEAALEAGGDVFAESWSHLAGLSAADVKTVASSWLVKSAELMTKIELLTVPSGEGSGAVVGARSGATLDGRAALFLWQGLGLSAAILEMVSEEPNLEAVGNELRHALVRCLVGQEWGPGSVCSAVVKTSGVACKGSSSFSSGVVTCGRHVGQDIITSLIGVAAAFPDFPAQAMVFAGGSYVSGPVALCSLCVRARPMEETVDECVGLGEPVEGEHLGLFSHWPVWMSEAGPRMLDRPGRQFCLACASGFPIACQLVAWLMASADGEAMVDSEFDELASRSLWVWCPHARMVSQGRVSQLRLFASAHKIAVPPFWAAAAAVPASPGMAAATVMRSGLARAKRGTNTALRAALGEEVAVGKKLAGKFESEVESEPEAAVKFDANFGGAAALERAPAVSPMDKMMAALGGGDTAVVERELAALVEARAASLYGREAAAGRVPARTADMAGSGSAVEVLAARLEEMELRLAGMPAAAPGSGLRLPVRPVGIPLPSEPDRDGFDASHRANAGSMFRARAEDYLGALLLPAGYNKRREFLTGRTRIDQSARRSMMPEEVESASEVMLIGELRVEGAAKRMGIPARGDYGNYAQARMTDLWASMVEMAGPHVKGSLGAAYATFETRVMLARYKMLAAVEQYLIDVRQPSVEYGAVWRYMCLLVSNMWLNKEIALISFDRDLVHYAMSAPVSELALRSAPESIRALAAASVNVDWLMDAQRLHDLYVGGKSGPQGQAQLNANQRCVCCGGLSSVCGGYFANDWKCTKEVKVACRKCDIKHLDRGTRSWRCGEAKRAASVLTVGEQAKAFAMHANVFFRGGHALEQAKVDAVKAAKAVSWE